MASAADPSPERAEEQPAVDRLSALSDDLAEQVLARVNCAAGLSAAAMVCHRWRALATSNRVWSNLYTWSHPLSGLALGTPSPSAFTLRDPPGHSSWRHAFIWKRQVDRAWRQRQPHPVAALQHHSSWVNCVRLLPAAQRVVSGSADEQVCIWHTEEGHLEAVCRTETSVYCMDALGAHVASGGVAGEVQLWDLHTGKQTGRLPPQSSRTSSVQLPPDMPHCMLVTHATSSPVSLWDTRTLPCPAPPAPPGAPPAPPHPPHQQQAGVADAVAAALQPDPAMQFAIPDRVPSGEESPPSLSRLRLTSARVDGNHVLVADQEGALHVYDVRRPGGQRVTAVRAYALDGGEGDTPYIFSLAVSRGRAATGSLAGLVKVWDVAALARAPLGQDLSCLQLGELEHDEENERPAGAGHRAGEAGDGGAGSSGGGAAGGSGRASGGGGGGGSGAGLGVGGLRASYDGRGLARPVEAGVVCPVLGVGVGHTTGVFAVAWGEEWQLGSASHDGSAAVWDTSRLALQPAGAAPVALRHPMAWLPSLDQPIPLGPYWEEPGAEGGGAGGPGGGADNSRALALRPNVPVGATPVGYRQMMARLEAASQQRSCAVHAIDLASEPWGCCGQGVQLAVGGRDAMVRIYSLPTDGRGGRAAARRRSARRDADGSDGDDDDGRVQLR